MFKIYQGCGLVNVGVTRKLIEFHRGERCVYAANKPFWMRPKDCENVGVKTKAAVNKGGLNKAIYRTEIATFVDWNKKKRQLNN